MDNYVKRIRTVDGDLQIDYKSLANLPDLTPNGLGAAPVKHTHNADDINGVIPIEKVGIGILPIANGGTEKGTRAEAIENLISAGYTSDANTALSVGTYSTDVETTNIPFQTYGTLFTYKPNQDWIVQIWASTNSTETCLYLRKNTNSDGFGNWFKILGNDIVLTMAQGGTGATKLEDVQKNILDGTYPADGTDISKLAPGIYGLPNDSNNVINAPVASWSPLAFVFGHQNNDTAADGSPSGTYFQGYIEWDGDLWIRRRKWDGWGDWKKIFSSSGGEITGDLTISKTSGFNYSGIEEGTSDSFRNVWFSDAGAKGKPCYHSGLQYNPRTQDLSIGGKSALVAGDVINYAKYNTNNLAMDSWIDNNAYTLVLRDGMTEKCSLAMWNGGALTVNGNTVYHTGNIDIQVGTLAVGTSGTTLTFPRPFAGTPVVTANSSNQTSVKVENVSATSVKLTAGTSGSTVQWQAIYIP